MSGYDDAALRARIPALASGTAFFDGPGGTQAPRDVADAIAAALAGPLSNRGPATAASRRADGIVLDARRALGAFLHSDPAGIVFGRSMTQLAYDLARTFAHGWGPGDEVVVTRLDHDAHVSPWIQAATRAGATVRHVDFDPDTGELGVGDVAAQLTDRTRLVAVTGASNLIGTRPPVAGIAARVHAAGALFSVDAVHLAAHSPVDRAALGADLLFCAPYKFMGPHLGVLAADPALLETLHPDKLAPATDAIPERFELGTLPYELLAGTTAALELIASLGGMAAVEAHEEALLAELGRGLDGLGDRVVRHGRAASRTPTLLLTFPGHEPGEVAAALADRGVNAPAGSFYALEASRWLGLGDAGGLRVGLAPYSGRDDVARLLEGLAELLA